MIGMKIALTGLIFAVMFYFAAVFFETKPRQPRAAGACGLISLCGVVMIFIGAIVLVWS